MTQHTKSFQMTANGFDEEKGVFKFTMKPLTPKGQAADDCRLMEAASDLLQACKITLGFFGGTADVLPPLDLLKKAIAKAEGRN